MAFRTLDTADLARRRVLLRADLNVPVHDGVITDLTRIDRLSPTIRELAKRTARVIVCSHFDRPKGRPVPAMSLAPLAAALGKVLGRNVRFIEDCIGPVVEKAVATMRDGEVIVLENTRFHPGEEANDPEFAKALAANAEIYVNDAFSVSHRAHASTEGVAHLLPAYAGRLMQAELEALDAALGNPVRPVMAIVAGAKVSTKIELLANLSSRVDVLVIGGAMANTFLAARGRDVAKSLQEPDMHATARDMLAHAHCEVMLPTDVVTAMQFRANPPTKTVPVDAVPLNAMILDVGPGTVAAIIRRLADCHTMVWNGPLGAFETPPFDAATNALAQAVAEATQAGKLRSVAGGGDTLAALRHAGVTDKLSYVSAAGGAFLEWMEGRVLPGVAALEV